MTYQIRLFCSLIDQRGAADAPNDALIVEDLQSGRLETAVIELFSPVYDMTTNTLTYTIMAENGTSVELPNEFGQTVMVVDENYPVFWLAQTVSQLWLANKYESYDSQ